MRSSEIKTFFCTQTTNFVFTVSLETSKAICSHVVSVICVSKKSDNSKGQQQNTV